MDGTSLTVICNVHGYPVKCNVRLLGVYTDLAAMILQVRFVASSSFASRISHITLLPLANILSAILRLFIVLSVVFLLTPANILVLTRVLRREIVLTGYRADVTVITHFQKYIVGTALCMASKCLEFLGGGALLEAQNDFVSEAGFFSLRSGRHTAQMQTVQNMQKMVSVKNRNEITVHKTRQHLVFQQESSRNQFPREERRELTSTHFGHPCYAIHLRRLLILLCDVSHQEMTLHNILSPATTNKLWFFTIPGRGISEC